MMKQICFESFKIIYDIQPSPLIPVVFKILLKKIKKLNDVANLENNHCTIKSKIKNYRRDEIFQQLLEKG